LDELRQELEEARADWAAEVGQLQGEMADMRRDHEKAERHCQAEKDRLQGEIDDLKELLAKRNARIRELEEQLAKVGSCRRRRLLPVFVYVFMLR